MAGRNVRICMTVFSQSGTREVFYGWNAARRGDTSDNEAPVEGMGEV
jgi:hypothetical protein